MNIQAFLFAICLSFVVVAQPLNDWARNNWKSFSTANYFQQNGFFVSMVFGVPNVLLAIVCLVNLIIGTAELAAYVKRMQFKEDARSKNAKNK